MDENAESTGDAKGGSGLRRVTRYPDYDVLAKWRGPDWDERTRKVLRERVDGVPPIRFLTPDEAELLEAIAARLVPQGDRAAEHRIPIVPWIDEKLHRDLRDGYRYEDLPPLREAWRLGMTGIDESAHLLRARAFTTLDAASQDEVLSLIQRGTAPGPTWARLPAVRFFRDVLCLTIVKIYYAQPAAWSEIGYSGPSSPRGHVRNWMGGVDPWDAHEAHE